VWFRRKDKKVTEQPAEPEDKGQNNQPKPKPKPNPFIPKDPFGIDFTRARRAPDNFQFYPPEHQPRTNNDLNGLTDAMLAALGVPPKPTEAVPVELSQERRAHILQRSAEFAEWQKNGFTRQEALAIVSMEIQLEHRFKKGGGQ
jgi:hypothetical protein